MANRNEREYADKIKKSPYKLMNCPYCGYEVLGTQGIAAHVARRHPGWQSQPTGEMVRDWKRTEKALGDTSLPALKLKKSKPERKPARKPVRKQVPGTASDTIETIESFHIEMAPVNGHFAGNMDTVQIVMQQLQQGIDAIRERCGQIAAAMVQYSAMQAELIQLENQERLLRHTMASLTQRGPIEGQPGGHAELAMGEQTRTV